MAPVKSAGRVSIRVLPDSSRFREDLKKALDRIEKSMTVKIQVIPVLDKKQLAEMKRQIEALAIRIKPDIDLSITRGQIEKIKAEIEAMDPMVEVNALVNTAEASNRIKSLTRDKLVNIVPQITRTAAKNFSQHLAAIAGASVIASEIQKGMHFLRTIDAHALRIAKQAATVSMVISMAGSAAQAVIGLGDGLIQALGVVSVAPALLASMGIAVAVFTVVLKDMKTVLADLGPGFSQLAREMSFKFWDEAADPIREMVNHLMPTLSEGMLLASTSMGKLTGQIAKSYKEHVTIEKFALMFDRVVESMDTVRGAVDPIIEAFTILGMHGTKYLNRLSKAIVTVTEDFRDWLKASEENGNLDKWTENGITAFKELGGIIKGVWNVFGALNTAIKTAGGPTLADFHRAIDDVAATMDSPEFQRAMVSVFRGMNTAVTTVATAIGKLGPTMANLAPTIERSFMMVGETFAVLIGYLGEIMGHPAVTGGINNFFESILKASKNLAPAIEPFSLALGSLLTLLGTVLENVAALVGTILHEWGPSLQKLSDTFDTLAEPLRVMLEDVVKALTPAIKTLVDDAIVPLLVWVRDHLIPAVSQFAEDVAPALEGAIDLMADVIEGSLPTLKKLTAFFSENEGEASKFKDTMMDLNQLFRDPEGWLNKKREVPKIDWDSFWNTKISFEPPPGWDGGGDSLNKWIAEFFIAAGKGLAKSYMDFCRTVDEAVANAWEFVTSGDLWDFAKDDWKKFIGGLEGMGEDLQKWWDGIWNDFRPAKDNEKLVDWQKQLDAGGIKAATAGIDIDLSGLLDRFKTWYTDFKAGWDGFWLDTKVSVAEWGTGVSEGLSTWWMNTKIGFAEWWTGLTEGWNTFWTGLGTSLTVWWAERTEGFSVWWTGVSEGFTTWWEGIKTGWNEFWTGLGESLSAWWTTQSEGFTVWWDGIKEGWNSFWSGLGENAAIWWASIKEGIATKTQEIKDGLKAKLEEMGIDTQSGWTVIQGLTSVAWEAVKSWLAQKWQEIKEGAKSWLSGLGIDVDGGWVNIKSNTSSKWQEIKQDIANKWNEIVGYVPGKLSEFGAHVRNGFEEARRGARDKMQEMKDGVVEKGTQIINWIRDLPGKLRSALSGTSLYNSGSSLIQGFKDGIIAKGQEAYEAAKGILQKIKNLFPQSPAKEGPFSGKGWTPYSGAALMDGFANGMSSKMGVVTKVARQMHSSVADEINSIKTATPDLTADGENASSGNMTVNIYNPIAEASSKTINRKSSMIKLGGSLS